MNQLLRVNPIECRAHGTCAELLPEMISLDEWGYPILDPRPVPAGLIADARRAVSSCPVLALRLERAAGAPAPYGPARGRLNGGPPSAVNAP